MSPFSGFPARTKATPVPEVFFSEVLPGITDLAELKLALVALRHIRRKKGAVRWVTASEMLAAPEVGDLGETEGVDKEVRVAEALNGIVERGVLIEVPLEGEGGVSDAAYFLNEPEGRRAAELVRAGGASVGMPVAAREPAMVAPDAGGIFHLYEEAIGPIPGAGMANELAEAELEYSNEWIREAFLEAASQNVRRWAYVRAILARWRDEGRSEDGTTERRATQDRYRAGKYGRIVRSK